MKDSNIYVIIFAAGLGITCALLLTAVAEVTETKREANKEAEKQRNIFTALGVPFDIKASAIELGEIYTDNIEEQKDGELEFFAYSPGGTVKALAFSVEGPGLWGPIKGFLALDPQKKKIKGLTFYVQEETPGLGGEIVTDAFRDGFTGKSIYAADGTPGIVIRTGIDGTVQNEVDGITGATMTCDKVQEMLNKAIEKIAGSNK